jgi:putative redox protein
MGLATCISTVFAMVATNSGIQYNSLSVEIEAQKEKTITNPKAKVCVKSDAPQEKLERILQKSMEICPVGILIEKAGIKIETKLVNEGL